MPSYYDREPIIRFYSQLDAEKYKEGYFLKKENETAAPKGLLLNLLSATFILLGAFAFISSKKNFLIFLIIFILSVLFIIYINTVRITNVKKRAEEIFISDMLLKEKIKVSIFRDEIICESPIESFKIYNSDIQFVLESSEFLVLTGAENGTVILSKENINGQDKEKLQEHLKKSFRIYKAVK